jgi:hypothetical protein
VYRLPFIVWSFLWPQTNTSHGSKKRSHVTPNAILGTSEVELVHLKSEKKIGSLKTDGEPCDVSFGQDGKTITVGLRDCVQIWGLNFD